MLLLVFLSIPSLPLRSGICGAQPMKLKRKGKTENFKMLRPRQPSGSQRLRKRNLIGGKKLRSQGRGELQVSVYALTRSIHVCYYIVFMFNQNFSFGWVSFCRLKLLSSALDGQVWLNFLVVNWVYGYVLKVGSQISLLSPFWGQGAQFTYPVVFFLFQPKLRIWFVTWCLCICIASLNGRWLCIQQWLRS